MLKISILDDGKREATEALLHSFIFNQPVEICHDFNQPLDILIVNKVPLDGSISIEHLSPGVVVANSGNKDVLQFIAAIGAKIITYGLNPRAAITASSHIDNDYVVCAIQRAMTTICGAPIMPREFSVCIKGHTGFDERVIGAVATALICGVNFE